jgi:hypothetical protein
MASAWAKPVEVRQGDPTKRVELPMPQNLPELRLAAQQHFGNNGIVGEMKLHKGGIAPVTRQDQVNMLVDEDVIVISFDGFEAAKVGKGVHITTQKRDFVAPPPQSPPPPNPRPQTRDLVPFAAASSYTLDYPARELPPQPRPKSSAARMYSDEPFTGRTTYAEHYPKKEAARQRPQPSAQPAPPQLPGARFDASTSYQQDSIKFSAPRHRPAKDPGADRLMPERAFEGETTYAAEFPNRRIKTRPTRRHQAPGTGAQTRQGLDQPCFRGEPEYRVAYRKHPPPRREKIYLEPETVGVGRGQQ